ncbi:MAG: hypothetical protein AAF416_05955 [Pseudomonadota bacterium]
MLSLPAAWIFATLPAERSVAHLDASALSYLLILPNSYGLEGWSPRMNLTAAGSLYLGLFLAYMALSYKPALVIWAGIGAMLSSIVGTFRIVSPTETRFFSPRDVLHPGLSLQATLILALTFWRSRAKRTT